MGWFTLSYVHRGEHWHPCQLCSLQTSQHSLSVWEKEGSMGSKVLTHNFQVFQFLSSMIQCFNDKRRERWSFCIKNVGMIEVYDMELFYVFYLPLRLYLSLFIRLWLHVCKYSSLLENKHLIKVCPIKRNYAKIAQNLCIFWPKITWARLCVRANTKEAPMQF